MCFDQSEWEKLFMSSTLKDLAVQYALQNKWQDACLVNEELLKARPDDVESLNRLGFAYIKLGKLKLAKDIYKKVIIFDKTNPIALKNLKKIETISKQGNSTNQNYTPQNLINLQDLYIEEAGKTRTIDLKNLADKKVLSLLQPGDSVKLSIKRSKVFVQTIDDKYIGMLPEDVGTRLISFMKGGNEYHAYLKAIDEKLVIIFIKETKRAARFKNQPSFSTIHGGSLIDN